MLTLHGQCKRTAGVGIDTFSQMIRGYKDVDPAKFNAAVDQHLAAITSLGASVGYSPDKVNLERWMEANWPTVWRWESICLHFCWGCSN